MSIESGADSPGSTWEHMTALLEATFFVQTLERRQGLRIACPEEVAYLQGFITNDEFVALAKKLGNSAYGRYLLKVAEEYPAGGE